MIRYDPTLVDLTSNFFVLIYICNKMKVYLYNYSSWVEPSMKEIVEYRMWKSQLMTTLNFLLSTIGSNMKLQYTSDI